MTAPSERLIRRIRQDFGRGTDDEVIRHLTALEPDDSSERIQAALVTGAAGVWSRFEQLLRQLELDWRAVLVAGGLANADWQARLDAELPARAEDRERDGSRPEIRASEKARTPRRDKRGSGARQPSARQPSARQPSARQPGVRRRPPPDPR